MALAGMLAGCGASTTTVSVEGAPTKVLAAGNTSSTGAPSTSTGSSAPTGSQAPARVLDLGTFRSPTGNIGCVIAGGIARCDIATRSWSPPPRPAGCPPIVDFGQGLTVGSTGAAGFVCSGDTVLDPASEKLPYGTAAEVGDLECVSRATGMTCTNTVSGHGFLISVQRYQLF
jgi:hypothetical protein